MSEIVEKDRSKEAGQEFPTAYAPFLPVLERLSHPMKTALKGHLASLEALFDAVQSRDRHLLGDFEGVGGLTHRGELSRILQSELLLRTEAPMEFLRRLAEHETLYMETERSDPSEKLIFRLIIAAGPELMGHGRIVALAGLIFLARVAHMRKTELHWCFLPNDRVQWHREVSVGSVKKFLKFVAFANPNDSDIEVANDLWTQVFKDKNSADMTFQDWVIGAEGRKDMLDHPDILATTSNALALSMDPPGRTETRTGVLDLKRGRASVKRVRLEFPADVTCVSALNRPFDPIRPDLTAKINQLGTRLPAEKGWEPLYFSSNGAGRFIVRFEYFGRGLLFFDQSYLAGREYVHALNQARFEARGRRSMKVNGKTYREPVFIPLPEDAQLAGVHFSKSKSQINVLLQRGKGDDERLVFNHWIEGVDIKPPRIKKVTSAHLFAKQRDHAIPFLLTDKLVYGYTTSGQPFTFKWSQDLNEPSINILYKEKRILKSDGHYHVTLFEPRTQVRHEGPAGVIGSFRQPGMQLGIGLKKSKWDYPIEPGAGFDRLRGAAFSPGATVMSFHPGQWKYYSGGLNIDDLIEIDIELPPYERIIGINDDIASPRLTVYSDPLHGGDGRVQHRWYRGIADTPTEVRTVYKFGASLSDIRGLRQLPDNSFAGVALDKNGDPKTLVRLYKSHNQYKKEVIPFDEILTDAIEIAAEKMFG